MANGLKDLLNQMLNKLPRLYNTLEDSNIHKLYTVISEELIKVKESLEKVEEYQDIDKSSGKTLDHHGDNVGQPRGRVGDQLYKVLIKGRIARNISSGDINRIKEILSTIIDAEREEIFIREKWTIGNGEPAAIELSVPALALQEYEIPVESFVRIVERIIAAGVGPVILITGTYQFSDYEDQVQVDTEIGLSDVEMEEGGTLGWYYDLIDEKEMPW